MTKEQMQAVGYHGAFGDCYRFLQRYGDVKDGDDFWNAAATEAVTISKKYEGTPAGQLTTAVLVAIYDELGRNYNTKYQNGGTQ